jgi:hypothetical protein
MSWFGVSWFGVSRFDMSWFGVSWFGVSRFAIRASGLADDTLDPLRLLLERAAVWAEVRRKLVQHMIVPPLREPFLRLRRSARRFLFDHAKLFLVQRNHFRLLHRRRLLPLPLSPALSVKTVRNPRLVHPKRSLVLFSITRFMKKTRKL